MENKLNIIKANIAQAKYLTEESALLYSDSSALRICISGIPAIGPIIDTLLSTKGQTIAYNRLLEFYNELSKEIQSIDEKIIDLEYVNSEDFYDLLMKLSESSIKTRSNEKKKLYAKILKNSCTISEIKTNPEYFIDIITEISLEEFLVGKKLFELKNSGDYTKLIHEHYDGKNMMKTRDVLALTDITIDKDDLDFILLRLQKVGLIKELTGSNMGYTGGSYELTKTFAKVMAILN